MSIVISSGHGLKIRGASGYLDEVNEARRVVNRVAELLQDNGETVYVFHDDVSTTQSENLNRIVNYHNSKSRDLDVSVHFNAYQTTSKPMGTECLYVTQQALAAEMASAVAAATGLPNRGAKKRTDLAFLNNTNKPAILVETVFVDSSADANAYNAKFDEVCGAIAGVLWEGEGPIPPEPEPPTPEPVPPSSRSTIKKGSTGPDVVTCQQMLQVYPADGDFGSITDGAVKGFQAACSISQDGIVGPTTWSKLDELEARAKRGDPGLPPELIEQIVVAAEASSIATYSWKGRGHAPLGYTAGVALCFAVALDRLNAEDEAAWEMAKANTGNPDKDVFAWYAGEFERLGMDNDEDADPEDRLRHLFALMLGLGMRESSGRYPEGRDQSATNTSADTAEAGMYQTSWNIRSCNSQIPPLLNQYWANPNGFQPQFKKGVTLKSSDLGGFGSGGGAQYQFLSKFAPAFHALVTGIGLRNLRQHWGPINRREVELRSAADDMLSAVQQIVEAGVEPAPEPEPEPDYEYQVDIIAENVDEIVITGDVYVTVNGKPWEPT